MARTHGTETQKAPQPPRTVEGFRADAESLGQRLDEFILDSSPRATAEARHAMEDARMHLLQAQRYLTRAEEHRHRRRRTKRAAPH